MGQRGRKSAASLSVVPLPKPSPPDGTSDPPPPDELSAVEKEVWRDTVNAMLPGWFAGSESLLQSYCAAAAVSRTLGEALRRDDLSDADAFEQLTRMHARTSALLASLAVKLRLCPSTNTDRRKPKRAPGRRPWDHD
jgi:hypothetical protein